ncbi:sucrose-6-phosphate hydrolase [Bacillus coahuilensis m2-6]|uniref:sucrose-6-phosphate hydrolase n=1 Tax=Bacillus coahuilensis TaxID=408580 RepID=UPI00075047BB|nr:sucrose-6-phosphate hydrolase [Bacillus coahuilensis]KUP04991.1 sucrose-6-phosphate hydrolase [Bacillus coahuilensis m2-6]
MTTRDEQLRDEALQMVEENEELVSQDPYRLSYHLMPPVGLLNDPNGFIQWKGTYHLFYQWLPFKTDHGAKFWGHYSSTDLVDWTHEPIALTPSEWFEKNGCYSGSAIDHDGKLYLFYTGNVKDEAGNRETYQCVAISEDGLDFDKKGPVVHLPDGYTAHFRDPKVWKKDGLYYMVVGAQSKELTGKVALFRSSDLEDWELMGNAAGAYQGGLQDFGYMWECPDLFELDGNDVLIVSPQGLEADGMNYQNVYQAGYFVGKLDYSTGSLSHGEFVELDRGFDFYAPQTTEDEKGRRLLVAWMSVPDQNEQDHPTIAYKWIHNMTIPRELKLMNGHIYQQPVEELKQLRKGSAVYYDVTLLDEERVLEGVARKSMELIVEELAIEEEFQVRIGGDVLLSFNRKQGVFTMERTSYVDGSREKRQCELHQLTKLQVYVDHSSVEAFINDGAEVFTCRFFPSPEDESVRFMARGEVKGKLEKYGLK